MIIKTKSVIIKTQSVIMRQKSVIKLIIPKKKSVIIFQPMSRKHLKIHLKREKTMTYIVSLNLTPCSLVRSRDLTPCSLIRSRDLIPCSLIRSRDLTPCSLVRSRDLTPCSLIRWWDLTPWHWSKSKSRWTLFMTGWPRYWQHNSNT